MTYIVVAKNGRRLCVRRNLGNARRAASRAGGEVYTPEALRVKQARLTVAVAMEASRESTRLMSRPADGLAARVELTAAMARHSVDTAQRMTAAMNYGTPNARSLS